MRLFCSLGLKIDVTFPDSTSRRNSSAVHQLSPALALDVVQQGAAVMTIWRLSGDQSYS